MTQDIKIMFGIAAATIAIVIGAAFLIGKPQNSTTATNTQEKVDTKILVKDNSFKISTSSAKATIVEFADFQCPACGSAHPITKRILSAYEGRVNYVFRHFPLTQIHKNALISAQAAESAGEQGKFWEMADLLFTNQEEWSESGKPLDIFVKYAKKLELDTEKFKKTVEENKFRGKIQDDQSDGNKLGVNSTPTFFIDGQKLAGVPDEDKFKKILDSAIKK